MAAEIRCTAKTIGSVNDNAAHRCAWSQSKARATCTSPVQCWTRLFLHLHSFEQMKALRKIGFRPGEQSGNCHNDHRASNDQRTFEEVFGFEFGTLLAHGAVEINADGNHDQREDEDQIRAIDRNCDTHAETEKIR